MLTSTRREAMAARVTKFLPLIWTCLWRRPGRTVLAVLATACAFTLYGLAWGTVAGVQQMAATQHVAVGPGLPLGAAFLSAIGFGLILFLTASATAQSVRLRLAEFGVLKALGFSHRLIVLLVAMEAILPSLAGAMLGLAAAGPLLPRLIGALPFPPGFPGMTYGPALPASAALLAILLGAASTALPALRIIRLDVATALAGAISSSTAMARAAGPDNAPRETAYAITPGAQGWRHLHRADPHFLRQIAVMTRIGLATLRHRIRGALTVMAALMVVTLVMNPLLILMDSFKAMMAVQGSPTHVMITQPGGRQWRYGHLPAAWAETIRHLPGIARAANGPPIVEARVFASACEHPERKAAARGICLDLDGLEVSGAPLHPPVHLLSGRRNRPGTYEIIMAAGSAAQHGAKVGSHFHLLERDWLVTGIFESNTFWVQGSNYGDAALIRAASGRDDISFVVAALAPPADVAAFRNALQSHPEIKADVFREDDFFRDFAVNATRGWTVVCYVVGALISIGAGAGVVHLMQVTVEERRTEMAVLRAIGFSGAAAAFSVTLEAMLLAAAGGFLGMIILWLWFDGTIYRGSLPIAVAWQRLAMAEGWALGVALIGALSPALAAARVEVAEALRK